MRFCPKSVIAALAALGLTVFPVRADVTIIPSIPYTLANGTVADATQVMGNFNSIISYVNANAAGVGSNTTITALAGLTAPPSGAGSLVFNGTTVAGTANGVTITATYPGSFTLVSGVCVWFQPTLSNTGATTLNVNSTGALAVQRATVAGLQALAGGELAPSTPTYACYNGVNWVLAKPANDVEAPLAWTNVASAATTALSSSACPNFKCQITGTTTITSFSNIATTGQIFYLRFASVLTLTQNATSLILPGAANITTAANDTAQALYLGSGNWQVLRYDQAVQPVNAIGGISPLAVGLVVTNVGSTLPNTQPLITAQTATLTNSANNASVTAVNVNLAVNFTTSGAAAGNDLDTGTFAANTWYHLYIISNGTTVAGLGSLSSTSPTLPAGYGYFMRVGAMKTDGATSFLRTRQAGVRAQYVVIAGSNTPSLPVIANGSMTAWSATQLAGWLAPLTASKVTLALGAGYTGGTIGYVAVAPNSAYTANSLSNGPPCNVAAPYASGTQYQIAQCSLVLESNSIYMASNLGTNTLISMLGWEDTVAAH